MVRNGHPNRDDIRALLCQLSGVERVDIRSEANGEITGLDVRVSGSIDERRLTRDIESALQSGLGYQIDHRSVRFHSNGAKNKQELLEAVRSDERLEMGGEAWHEPRQLSPPGDRRVKLNSVRCVPDGELYAEVTVELEINGESYRGKIRDADTPHGRMLMAARSTLRALAPTLASDTAFVLEGLEVINVESETGVLAVLRARSGRDRPYFHGSAIVREDATEAAARAVLDGLNRYWAVRSTC